MRKKGATASTMGKHLKMFQLSLGYDESLDDLAEQVNSIPGVSNLIVTEEAALNKADHLKVQRRDKTIEELRSMLHSLTVEIDKLPGTPPGFANDWKTKLVFTRDFIRDNWATKAALDKSQQCIVGLQDKIRLLERKQQPLIDVNNTLTAKLEAIAGITHNISKH